MSTDETSQRGDEWVIPPEDAPGPAPGRPPRRTGRLAKVAAPVLAAALLGGGAVLSTGHRSPPTAPTAKAAVSIPVSDTESDDGGSVAVSAASVVPEP